MNCGIQCGATFDTIEAFFVPIEALGSNAFRIKNLQKEETGSEKNIGIWHTVLSLRF